MRRTPLARHAIPGAWAALCLLGWLAPAEAPAGETRFHQYTRKYAEMPDRARVVRAGSLGGAGTEWFAGGGFAPDGAVVAAGTALGPTIEAGVGISVIGRDTRAPAAPKRVQKTRRGKPEFNKDGSPKWAPFSWRHENPTGFVVIFEPGMSKVRSASRFPWRAGSVTSAAVDAEGNIYLTGSATAGIALISRDVSELRVADNQMKGSATSHTYLARLSPDARRCLWVRHMKAPSNAPEVTILKDGNVSMRGPDIRTFDASGKLVDTVIVPGGLGRRVAVNPVDGTYARGGEHHWRTGREPWRCPILNIHKADGELLYQLYDWGGPYVGLDNLRLVSDTAIREVAYDEDGNLIIYAWSDGGNSVMTRQPNDVRRGWDGSMGLGMSAWGAGVLSCSYIVKIETKTYTVAGGTVWLAYLSGKNKPNSIWIDRLGFATDGSLCYAGRSAWGLIQTGNKLVPEAEPAGPYVAVLNGPCNSLRFCSSMPACGKVEVGDGTTWGIAQGVVDGKPMVMFLTGAADKDEIYGKTLPPPVSGGWTQAKHGGGFSDAYAILLDLGANAGGWPR